MGTTERQHAFLDLLVEHQGILHKVCALYATDAADREDLRQEVVLALWRAWPAFRGEARVSTWMYRVALNVAMLRARRRGARREVAIEDEPLAPAGRDEDADEGIRLLHACIRELSEVDRAIVLLHLEKHSYDEIAALTGLTRSNVSVRLVRLKARLRERLLARGYRAEEQPCPRT
jgi:RNA polymerase sigma-70 factor (ECF subfamily)